LPKRIESIVRDHGPVEVLVNNAGFAVADFAEDIQLDELRLQLKRISSGPLR
jgi:NADP-dependent 3-hydroxy acid dehydrogenase YdfG